MCSVAVEEMLSSFCAQQDSWTDILTVADKHYFIHSLQFSSCIFGFAKAIKKKERLSKWRVSFTTTPGTLPETWQAGNVSLQLSYDCCPGKVS